MKKLVFATALALGSLTMGTAATPIIFHDGIMEDIFLQDYTEVATSDVPTPIIEALEADYAGAILNKAYVDDENKYKLEVSMEDGTSTELYADANGNWIEM
ncbi:hypothetical protein SAMN04488008_102353 [Maribacter orientalis]|uniref:Beta-lactamase-inhibitor-like, PepSY-like n=1 Tax=Maribacter orientalis TaxID=228957 RepID=A0A1H7KMW4_9FLAO|nr:hypothetical protein [Maribacter orientalis]SEK87856.1 hypothetical protein SAMN04488008_102353 [Maribacter orientalis]|tara:strand:+ start:368 stop:670 length:303 start_codon:yes stop_codon:yes gene_type:complete